MDASGRHFSTKGIIWFWVAVDYIGLKAEVTNCINRSRINCVKTLLGGQIMVDYICRSSITYGNNEMLTNSWSQNVKEISNTRRICSWKFFMDCLTVADGIDRLCCNTGNQLPIYAA
jgi:hypothetical protein